jgi:hypothetical protein
LVKIANGLCLFLQKKVLQAKIPAFFAKTNSVFSKAFPVSGIYYEKLQMQSIYQLGTAFS